MAAELSLEGVGFSYEDAAPILEKIDLEIPAGQFVCLLGASGSGKSTLLRLLAGLQFPDQGRLLQNGKPITGPGFDRGVVFQDYALFPWMTVVDNIAIAIGKAQPGTRKADCRAQAVDYLGKVGLESAVGQYPFELSGGMRQRAAIARALALRSPVLLMDEPFGALDPTNRARLQDLLTEAWETEATKKTIVFVTHDIDEALYLGDRVVVLGSTPGRLIADLPVPFARHRDRRSLFDSSGFHALRESIAETLAADTLRQLVAA
ncbi:ABC transporter ATP-binding protein [Thauera linaloolentis]|uniref:Nitrate/sulfonate/bicarbonate ABC transporter ATPase n=1 Tax=Thauera linaloolentis (strain DSM 12138 / JCM 21573 / CCUG 41526 / CIP 105981 / IAM 15112 / NBRC 102519 / 47Lol) TaxID=1123367 RepID=N6YUX5_THAL4|nr:ABC transporter ATP-binding protein [Thauera linaloolentis]ENO85928.1 nitrate/sulfonate/bicarbonate ABC transporter ATPase [Thauera linaloolentis 47Lol = DSM 12138]MCM8567486.1 ABC transporter ATP-binding protein [Thauera linaloolentis]